MTWSWIWGVYVLLGVILELVALFRPESDDTLSEHVWALFSNPTWGKFITWMFTAFLVWMAVHFASKGRLG